MTSVSWGLLHSLEEVLGNRDLLQRIARFTLGAANGESETTVPLCLGHTQEWGSLLLVDHFSKVSSIRGVC